MKLKRPLRGSETGADVRMVQRALNKAPSQTVIAVTGVYDETTQRRVRAFRTAHSLSPGSHVDQVLLDRLWPYFDVYGRMRYRAYKPPVPLPILIEPNQGWASLDKSLWQAYSAGRRAGLSDLGTYNPDSRLPSGAPSDHAVYPAKAFDLGIDPDTGWENLKARAYCIQTVKRPEIAYAILGNRIWTDWRKVWGAYYSGGHLNHAHISGHR